MSSVTRFWFPRFRAFIILSEKSFISILAKVRVILIQKSLKIVIFLDKRKFGDLSTKITLTLARIEINDFCDKILKALSLGIRNLVPELIYLDSNSRYAEIKKWPQLDTILDF